jgi:hypothetical protein
MATDGTDDARDDLEFFGPLHPGERLIGYNLDEQITGIKVRHVFKVVSGDRARAIDARQAKVILEILEWIRDHPELAEQARQDQAKPSSRPPAPPGPAT